MSDVDTSVGAVVGSSPKNYYRRACPHLLAERDRLAAEVGRLREALNLALCWLVKNEPGDSRAVSNEFVAMAAVHGGYENDECMAIIRAALAGEGREDG